MTINKAQRQSLKLLQVYGLYLENSCFSHGQLYVACSRVGKSFDLFVYAPEVRTKNIVYCYGTKHQKDLFKDQQSDQYDKQLQHT